MSEARLCCWGTGWIQAAGSWWSSGWWDKPAGPSPGSAFTCVSYPGFLYWLATPETRGQEKRVKVRSSVKPICEHCKVIKRQGVVRIICKRNPKHKQRQG